MKYRLHFVSVTHPDEVTEVVLDDGQVIDVIPDVRWKDLLVALPDDLLFGLVRRTPIDVQRNLVRLHQRALPSVRAIEEEVDVASAAGLVRLERRVDDLRAS